MRIARRRGVAEGVIIGTAVAGGAARRSAPTVVAVPAYPAYYGAPPATTVVYGAPAVAPNPSTEIVINTSEKMPPPGAPPVAYHPGPAPYYPQPPPPVMYPPPAAAPMYPSAPVVVNPAPPPYIPAPAPAVIPPAAIVAAAAAGGGGQHHDPALAGAMGAAAVARAVERRHFLIVNEANCSVLEVQRGNVKPNSLVVCEKRRPDKAAQQVWYADETGVVRSKLNDFAMESKDNGKCLRMMPYTGDARQKWTIKNNNRLANEVFCNDCVGLKKGPIRLKDDADVIVGPYEGKPYQHWRIEYI